MTNRIEYAWWLHNLVESGHNLHGRW